MRPSGPVPGHRGFLPSSGIWEPISGFRCAPPSWGGASRDGQNGSFFLKHMLERLQTFLLRGVFLDGKHIGTAEAVARQA